MSSRLSGILCLTLILISLPFTVNAQSAASASISSPQVEGFPQIETYLDIHDAQGNFVHNLGDDHVRLLEDESPATVTSLRELRLGVQLVVALNPGPTLGVRNSQAVSRYDTVKEALRAWATNRQGSTIDDLSLQITNGPGVSHVSDPMEWLSALDTDQTDARNAEPNLDILFQAITLAADPSPRTGMGRAVLFITPPPDTESIPSMENIFSQALGNEIPIFVWMVASSGGLGTQGAQRLIELTEASGGQVFTFTGEETLPDPETYYEPLRSIYHLTYESQVTSSGAHQLVAQVQIGGELVSTPPQSFEINIQPPTPTFVSPPIQIVRSPDPDWEGQENGESTPPEYIPKGQPIEVVFDFPDERKRPIVYSALFIDGELAHENEAPPFETFTWDLQAYNSEATHQLQVKARDSLGLVGTSAEIPVYVTIEQPKENPWTGIEQNLPLLIGLIVLVAGAILVLVLVLGGRLRPSIPGAYRTKRRRSDPVTQPVPKSESSPRRIPSWANPLQWSQRSTTPKALAYLSRISETDNLAIEPPIPITSNQVTIGIDPNQATLVLDHPSIENLHARIVRNKDGEFRLADEGSIAGTWINYTPVSSEGAKLEHGDLIHIGRLGFRFTIRDPQQVRKPVITMASPPTESQEQDSDTGSGEAAT